MGMFTTAAYKASRRTIDAINDRRRTLDAIHASPSNLGRGDVYVPSAGHGMSN
jgi:hypothetical protein